MFLIVRGFFTRQLLQILVGIGVLLTYGSVLWGVLPTTPGISWQAHLFGAVGGLLAASMMGKGKAPTGAWRRYKGAVVQQTSKLGKETTTAYR